MESQTVLKTAGGKTLTGSTPVPSAKFEKAMLKILQGCDEIDMDEFIKHVPKIHNLEDLFRVTDASKAKSDDSILTETGAQCRETEQKA